MKLNHIKDNTFYLNPKYIDLGFYHINESQCILIDTGYEKTAQAEIIPFMELVEKSVKGILCTHGHLDHVGGNHLLKSRYDSQIASPYVESIFGENTYNMYMVRNNFRFSVTKEALPNFSCQTDYIIQPNEEIINFLDIPFKTIPLGGHSPNQLGYITPDNVAYLADAIISESLLQKTKIPYIFDVARDLESKKSLKNLNCDYYILSHEGVYDDISNLIDLNISFVKTTVDRLLDLLTEPRNFEAYTANVMKKMDLKVTIKNIVYLQEIIRNFVSYFLQSNLIDVFEENGCILLVKK